jgi:nitroreductase
MDVQTAIRSKRAVREYADRPLADETARAILHAGRRAQSARNAQPWDFVAVRDRENLRRLVKVGPYIDFVARSAMSVVIVTPPPATSETILFDAGQAAACMQLAAWELGVASCVGSIYEQAVARDALGFPESLYARILIAFGYPRDTKRRAARKGGRRPLEEVVHWERW